jgi:hypothetical protein
LPAKQNLVSIGDFISPLSRNKGNAHAMQANNTIMEKTPCRDFYFTKTSLGKKPSMQKRFGFNES